MSCVPSLNFADLQKEPQLQDIIPSLIVAFGSRALGNMTPGLYTVCIQCIVYFDWIKMSLWRYFWHWWFLNLKCYCLNTNEIGLIVAKLMSNVVQKLQTYSKTYFVKLKSKAPLLGTPPFGHQAPDWVAKNALLGWKCWQGCKFGWPFLACYIVLSYPTLKKCLVWSRSLRAGFPI